MCINVPHRQPLKLAFACLSLDACKAMLDEDEKENAENEKLIQVTLQLHVL